MTAHRVGRHHLARLRDGLSDRDLAVIRSVDEFRLLSARQIERLHFADHASPLASARASRRVLERHARQRFLVRLERRIGGVRAGSSSYVYALGPVGHRVQHPNGTRRWREPSETFVAHTLAVAQVVVDLTDSDRQGDTELISYHCEPDAWRRFNRGLAGHDIVKPDLHVVTGAGEEELHWFVEIDLGTESGTTIVRKCRTYHDYWGSGTEQDRHGTFPKVLWIADTPRRANLIERAVARARAINHELFAITTNDRAVAVLGGARR